MQVPIYRQDHLNSSRYADLIEVHFWNPVAGRWDSHMLDERHAVLQTSQCPPTRYEENRFVTFAMTGYC